MTQLALQTPTATDRVALRGVRLRSTVRGLSQRTTLEQTFVNLEDRAIEAVYTFPLPDDAAVCGFEIVTGDRVLTGQVEESQQANEQYDEAIAQGDGAFMVEQDRPDIFTARVGNLKPKQAATVRLTYVGGVDLTGRSLRLAFPTTVAPRYVTATATDPLDAALDGDAINPPHVLHVPFGLSMEVDIELGAGVKAVNSPSHSITATEQENGVWRVTLTGKTTDMDRDIVLDIEPAKSAEPFAMVEQRDGEQFAAVTFIPEFEVDDMPAPQPTETIFVIDCSGSMGGPSITQARAALELCLRGLSAGDMFNIVRFGSTFETMSPEPLCYSDDTLKQAMGYVRRIEANLGGTELYRPLQQLLPQRVAVGEARQIILLTDGQVSNEAAIHKLAKQHRAFNRIFTFGIGPAASKHLVSGLAEATGGAAEFIAPGERIEDKVLRTFGRIGSPVVSNVAIDFGVKADAAPAHLPPIFDGDALTVFARSDKPFTKPITLSCTTPTGKREWKVDITGAEARSDTIAKDKTNAGLLSTMWARRTINELEAQHNLQSHRYRRQQPTAESQRVIDLSKRFNVLSALTSFICIEHRSIEERNEGKPELRRVPTMLAAGWGGIEMVIAQSTVAGAGRMLSAAPASQADSFGSDVARSGRPRAARRGARRKVGRAGENLHDVSADRAMSATPQPNDDLHLLLFSQSASGEFDAAKLIDRLLTHAGLDATTARNEVTAALSTDNLTADLNAKQVESLTNTVLAQLLLRKRFADRHGEWRRADAKAQRYVASLTGDAIENVADWLDALVAKVFPSPARTPAK